jgi:CRISPR-associated protein Cas1
MLAFWAYSLAVDIIVSWIVRGFYFTGDYYRYHFEPEAKQCFLDLIRERFNSGVRYKGRTLKWDTVIEQKAAELGRYFVSRSSQLDFMAPPPNLCATDYHELGRRILDLSHSDAKKLGIEKSTLHYLRKRAKSEVPLRIYDEVRRRLREI